MRFHQVRELVRGAASYHADLADAYAGAATGDVGERLRMALDYLAEHERGMQAVLERYLSEDDEHRGVLDTWFDDPVDVLHAPVPERLLEGIPRDGVLPMLAAALTAHRTLQDVYAQRAEHAVSTAEREFFGSLIAEHEGEVRRLSRNLQRLEDS